MNDINPNKLKNIADMSPTDHYLYFVRKVSDFEEVWGLYNEGWARARDESGHELILFWPEKAFAQVCAADKFDAYKPQSINLKSFLSTRYGKRLFNGRHILYPAGKGACFSARQIVK